MIRRVANVKDGRAHDGPLRSGQIIVAGLEHGTKMLYPYSGHSLVWNLGPGDGSATSNEHGRGERFHTAHVVNPSELLPSKT
jgi:hypothetical protein